MVKIGLQFSAFLENVTDLKPEDEEFRWYLKLKCNRYFAHLQSATSSYEN